MTRSQWVSTPFFCTTITMQRKSFSQLLLLLLLSCESLAHAHIDVHPSSTSISHFQLCVSLYLKKHIFICHRFSAITFFKEAGKIDGIAWLLQSRFMKYFISFSLCHGYACFFFTDREKKNTINTHISYVIVRIAYTMQRIFSIGFFHILRMRICKKKSSALCIFNIFFSFSPVFYEHKYFSSFFFCLRYDSFIVWCSTRNIHSCAIINQRQDRKQSNEWRKERNLNKICMEWAI